MASMETGNAHMHRNVDDFGGMPFYSHMGSKCHRGIDPFKKFHANETAKRVTYREDGTGRDGYITANNGGLSINNYKGVMGTDLNHNFQASFRGYGKDKCSPYSKVIPQSLHIVDNYIH